MSQGGAKEGQRQVSHRRVSSPVLYHAPLKVPQSQEITERVATLIPQGNLLRTEWVDFCSAT